MAWTEPTLREYLQDEHSVETLSRALSLAQSTVNDYAPDYVSTARKDVAILGLVQLYLEDPQPDNFEARRNAIVRSITGFFTVIESTAPPVYPPRYR